jgi:sugar lactone lactonase YvrE
VLHLSALALTGLAVTGVGGVAVAGIIVARTSGPFSGAADAPAAIQTRVTGSTADPRTPTEQGGVRTIVGGPDHKGPPVDGPSSAAKLNSPGGVAVAPDGTIFFADVENHVVVRVDSRGNVARIAGSGRQGIVDGPASEAEFYGPTAVAVGADGTLYIADGYGHRLRRLDTNGLVTTLAGGGEPGLGTGTFADGEGTDARFDALSAVVVDSRGDIIVADYNNQRIRRVTRSGSVTTLAGSGVEGNTDGQALSASFAFPSAIALGADGSLWVTEHGNNDVRRVYPDGRVVTVVKSTLALSPGAAMSYPSGIAVKGVDEVFVSDTQGNRLIRVFPDGSVQTIAGNGEPAFADGGAGTARLRFPVGLAISPGGTLVFADKLNSAIRELKFR